MYVRLTTWPLTPHGTERARELARRYEEVLHSLPGHVSTTFYFDPGGNLVCFSVWADEDRAIAVTSRARNSLQRDLADVLTGDPSTTIVPAVVHDQGR
jgi:hypothetical protein